MLQALARVGVFRLRAVLVGTHAFRLYPSILGAVIPEAHHATEDIDLAQFHAPSTARLIRGSRRLSPRSGSARIVDDRFTAVQQAIGTGPDNRAGIDFLRDFVEQAKASDLVAHLIERHRIGGLSVAPQASRAQTQLPRATMGK